MSKARVETSTETICLPYLETMEPYNLAALQKVRNRIGRGWCQGEFAVAQNGGKRRPWSKQAKRWCLLGAMMVETGSRLGGCMDTDYFAYLLGFSGCEDHVSHFNDNNEYEVVKARLDEAIRNAERAMRGDVTFMGEGCG